jgi:hypothetical protein
MTCAPTASLIREAAGHALSSPPRPVSTASKTFASTAPSSSSSLSFLLLIASTDAQWLWSTVGSMPAGGEGEKRG